MKNSKKIRMKCITDVFDMILIYQIQNQLPFFVAWPVGGEQKSCWIGDGISIPKLVILAKYILILLSQASMFGGSLKVSGQLHNQLNRPDLTPQELFAIPNIIGDIKQNIQLFLTFCHKRKKFTTQMLQLCFDSTYQILSEQKNKAVAYNTAELLSCDDDALSSFLFTEVPVRQWQDEAEVCEKIEEIEEDGIVTDAERLFSEDNPEDQWKKDPDAFEKYEIVKLSLSILQNPEKNETCLGYINKIYSTLIRREGKQFLEFLSSNPKYVQLMIQGTEYYAIGNLLMLLLSSQDKSGQYKFQNFKRQIFSQLLDHSFKNIDNREKFEGILITVEEILNTTKQSYYEYFQDFKRCANVLVCEKTLRIMLNFALENQGNTFLNAVSYLQLILKRINNQNDEIQNDYYRQNDSGPSMKFQHHFMFNQLPALVQRAQNIVSGAHIPTTKILFFSFLIQLLRNSDYKQLEQQHLQQFKLFCELLFQQKSHGMVKNYIYQIVNVKLNKMSEETIVKAAQWLYDESSENIKNELANLNPFDSLVKINSNQSNCFLSKIIHIFHKKCASFIESLQKQSYLKANKIFTKYEIKLAKEEEKPEKNLFNHQFKLQLPLQNWKKKKQNVEKEEKEEREEEEKNGITIDDLINDENVRVEEQQVERVELNEFSRQFIIEDLKNTKIQLPDRYKNEEEKCVENGQMEYSDEDSSSEEAIKVVSTFQSQFFIKHLILF